MKHTREFLDALFGWDMHAARIESLANGVAGVLSAAVLSIHAIGHAYAVLGGTKSKSGIKQIDRLLSNPGVTTPRSSSRRPSTSPSTSSTRCPTTSGRQAGRGWCLEVREPPAPFVPEEVLPRPRSGS